jgi:hypothetical protein
VIKGFMRKRGKPVLSLPVVRKKNALTALNVRCVVRADADCAEKGPTSHIGELFPIWALPLHMASMLSGRRGKNLENERKTGY